MKYLFVIFLAVSVLSGVYSQDLSGGLSPGLFFTADEIERVINGDLIPRMFVKYNSRGENSHDSIRVPVTEYNNEDFSQYEVIVDDKGFIPYDLNEQTRLQLFNIMTGFSKLEGIPYYSRRARRNEVLIVESFRVNSLNGNRVPDRVYSSVLPTVENIFKQKDNKLGTMHYNSSLFVDGDNFIMLNRSITSVTKGIITINNPGDLKTWTFLIYDRDRGGFFYYSVMAMRVRVDFVLKMDIFSPTTFSNRLRASTVRLSEMMGFDRSDKYNAWPGIYDSY